MVRPSPRDNVKRVFGLSLGGARSDRTCLTVIDFYQRDEKSNEKAFVVDVFEGIGQSGELDGDEALLKIVNESLMERPATLLAVDAPLTLPPCFVGCADTCEGYQKCKRPTVKWMRNQFLKARQKNRGIKGFTPYLQRPVDIYFRYQFTDKELFKDDTLGANYAPQAARMQYLKQRWLPGGSKKNNFELIEVWPKLVLFCLQKELKLTRKEATGYRNVEQGAGIREKLLETLSDRYHIFVYERDASKLLSSVPAFDSFICAFVALQYSLGRVVDFKHELNQKEILKTGWIELPNF